MRRRHPAAGLALSLTVMLALAGCGGGGSGNDQVASLAEGTTASASAGATSAEDSEKEVLAYVECLRDNGADVPDPTFDADGNMTLGGASGSGAGVQGLDQDALSKAQEACGDVPAGITSALGDIDQSQFQDAALEFAKCMRKEGVDVGDPDFSKGFSGGAGGIFPGLDLQDPKTQKAADSCQSVFAQSGVSVPGGTS